MNSERCVKRQVKLSVITVVFNAADRIRDTIISVTGQDYDNIEYIIKDGGSTDGTVDIVRDAAAYNDNIRYVSASDNGIYDAMNRALSVATGDVIQFLNAGDRFASNDVVSRSMRVMNEMQSDIVYGDIVYENQDGTADLRTYPSSCSWKLYYLTGDCINHQCMFVRRSLFEGNSFNTSFKICADREWMLRVGVYSSNLKMTALGFIIVKYPLDGASVINKERYTKEVDICIRRYLPWGYPIFKFFEFLRSHKKMADKLHNLYKVLYFK